MTPILEALQAELADSPRLAAVAAWVPAGSVAADIGTDHARLPIAWVRSGWCASAYAFDVADAPLAVARRNIRAAGLHERVDVRRSDGMAELSACTPHPTAATICGMGGRTIARIVAAGPRPGESPLQRVVVQPNKRVEVARAALLEHGWLLLAESLVEDAGRIYPLLVADASAGLSRRAVDDDALLVGPHLTQRRDDLFARWVHRELAWRASRAEALTRAGAPEAEAAEREAAAFRRLVRP